jgi:hypothetical protein
MTQPQASTGRVVQAGILTWILPGAGHYWLGHRGLGVVFFLGVSLPYWTGVAVGGMKSSVNPFVSKWLFLAELGTGGYTSLCYALNHYIGEIGPKELAILLSSGEAVKRYPIERREQIETELLATVSYYPESDVAQIYLAVGGLLNLVVILDGLARAQSGGLPVFYHETPAAREDQTRGAT